MRLFQHFLTILLGVFILCCFQSAICFSEPTKAIESAGRSIETHEGENKDEVKKIVIFGAGYVGTIDLSWLCPWRCISARD